MEREKDKCIVDMREREKDKCLFMYRVIGVADERERERVEGGERMKTKTMLSDFTGGRGKVE